MYSYLHPSLNNFERISDKKKFDDKMFTILLSVRALLTFERPDFDATEVRPLYSHNNIPIINNYTKNDYRYFAKKSSNFSICTLSFLIMFSLLIKCFFSTIFSC